MYNILIVEDESLSRHVMNLIIVDEFKNDVNVIQAEDGLKAKQIIEDENIDLGIIDMNIPGIKGIEICKYLRIKYNDIPIIVTTGDYDNKLSEKILELNVNEYLVKPIEFHHILKILKKYIKFDSNKIETEFIEKQKGYVKNISKNFIKGEKKETIKLTQEYINLLYERDDNDCIRDGIMTIINQIKSISKKANIYLSISIEEQIIILEKSTFINMDKQVIMKAFIKIYDEIFDNTYDKISLSFNSYIKEAINYVEKNVKKNITLDEVANSINITPHYLSKIFKKQVGINFVTFITEKKIEVAKEMLIDKDIPIVNIALELSYTQPNYFSKVFKNKVGITPSEYREQYFRDNSHIKTK